MKAKTKLRVKLVFLQIFSFIFSITPLAIAIVVNRDKYFSTPEESVKLGIGVIIAIVFIVIKALGKLKIPPRIVTFGAVFAMSYLLKSVLADLMLLSGLAFLGEALDLLFFQAAIRRTRERITAENTADATAGQVEKLFERYIGSGRT